MGDKIRFGWSAAFYLLALAATMSGLVSKGAALMFALIGTAFLFWASFHFLREWHAAKKNDGRRGLDSWYFIAACLVVAILAVAGAAYGVGLRSSGSAGQSQTTSPQPLASESSSQAQIAELQKELAAARDENSKFARQKKLEVFLNDLPQNLKMIEGYASTVFQYKGQPVPITGFKPKQWAIDAERRWNDALKDLGQKYNQASGDTVDLTPTLPTTMELTYSATGEDAITDEGQRQRFRIFSIQKTKADGLLNRIQSSAKSELEKANRQISELR
jgi:hypothetical protein